MGAAAWLTAALAAIALLALWGAVENMWHAEQVSQESREIRRLEMRQRARRVGVVLPDSPPSGARLRLGPRGIRLRSPPRLPDPETLSLMALEVSSRLQSGEDLTGAWARTWERCGSGPLLGVEVSGVPHNLLQAGRRKDDIAVSGAQALVTACRFSFLVGAPLAGVLQQVADGISRSARARQAQDQAFTGPQMSARILTALPLLAIVGGEALGAHTLEWFAGGGLGTLCALAGLVLLALGHGSTRRMMSAARARSADEMEATILCDLARSGLQVGAAIPSILSALGKAVDEPALPRIAKELVMGAGWAEAWEPIPARAGLLAQGLQPGWEQGVSPILLLEHAAQQSREKHLARAEEEAARLAVKLVVPLGLFLLPAFVVWGVIPVVVSLFGSQLGL